MNDNSAPSNPARRRLAKGGLAAPVVLASLSSKNAFAAALPYHCFVSGKLSNNMSPYGPNAQTKNDACVLPQSRPSVQAGLQNNPSTFSSVFGIPIYVDKDGQLTLSARAGQTRMNRDATLYDVLTLPSGSNPVPMLDTLQRAVVIYQNAQNFPPPNALVPLTFSQVAAMTRAAYYGGSYTVTTSIGSKTFTAGEIQGYFLELSA